ncbi:MAG: transporter substrate-binding domain-containing protein, partial [Alphaproteobacteria bacterium]
MTKAAWFTRLLASAIAILALGTGSALAQAKSTWETIKERGSIRVGVVQAEPWAFSDPLTKEWTGIAPSYGRAVAEALGVKLEFVEVTWGTAVASLQSNKIDIMPNLSVTPERAVAIEYSNSPLAYSELAILVPQAMKVATWDDLDKPDITVGVNQGSSEDAYVTKRLTKAKILRFSSYAEDLAAFQNGNVNMVALYHPTLVLLVGKVSGAKVVVPKPVRVSFSDTAVRREPDKTLRDWLTTANNFYYTNGLTEEWYENFLRARGI